MLLRITAFVLGLALVPAYAAAPADTQLSAVYANMLGEFSDRSITNDERYVRLKKHYAAAVDTLGNPAAASNEGLRAAFSMSEVMLLTELGYSQPLPQRYVADMSAMFKELSRRDAVSAAQRDAMIGAHLSVWQVEEAKVLATQETRIKGRGIVALQRVGEFDPTAPAVVLLSDGIARAMPFEFPQGPTIVVSAGCHIARRAAEAIYADARLGAALGEANVLWLSPASATVDPVVFDEWNARFPDAQMYIAFDNSKWQGVDFARLPSFHFYMDGKLVTRISGWGDDIAMLGQIWTALESIGIDAPE